MQLEIPCLNYSMRYGSDDRSFSTKWPTISSFKDDFHENKEYKKRTISTELCSHTASITKKCFDGLKVIIIGSCVKNLLNTAGYPIFCQ
ncbi:MAG: hypothetical protein IGNPGNKH_00521 [Sodalis sp. Ffu]|nr:MAG: hypothetical protein IGNPGNKH_00521 [Sodalis sp. Ffu]